jgi:hypothetical protein
MSHPQYVYGRGRVINPSNSTAGALCDADTWGIGLALAGAALQLPHQLNHLCDTCGTQWVALGEQAATWVDWNAPANLRGTRLE